MTESRRTPSSQHHKALPTAMLLLVAVLLASPGFGQDAAMEMVLRRVVVMGLAPPQEETIRAVVPLPLGEPLTPELLARMEDFEEQIEAANVGSKLQRFAIRPLEQGADTSNPEKWKELELVLDFRLPPQVESVTVFPLIPVKRSRFEKVLPVKKGDRFDPEGDAAVVKALEEAAKAEGFDRARVTTHHLLRSEDAVSLGYIIEDVYPPPLYKIRFRDAGFGNATRIRDFLRQPEPVGFDKESDVTSARLDTIEDVSADLMRSIGYLKAKAWLDKTSVSKRRGASVYYRIDKGPRFKMESVEARGEVFADAGHWGPVTERLQGRPITSKRLKELEDGLVRRALRDGYMDPVVKVDFATTGEDTVAVTANVKEGGKSVMGGVTVDRQASERGYGTSWYHRKVAPPVKEELIRRAVRVQPGEELNLKVVEDTERRLWNLGTFEDVKVSTTATTDSVVRDMKLSVKERRTGGLGITMGWNDQLGPVTRLSYAEANVGGRADGFAINTFGSLRGDGFGGDVSYFDRHWKTGEKLLGEEREPSMLYQFEHSQVGFKEYTEKRTGGRMRLTYLTGERYGPWSNSWQVRAEEIGYEPWGSRDDYDEPFTDYLATTLRYHITYDTRDRGDDNATRGWLFDTSLEAGAADGLLLKWLNIAQHHQPLSRHFSWVAGGQFGLMPVSADKVGLSDRFFLGGLDSVRGFNIRGAGPVDDKNDNLHVGGATMASIQNEIRWHVTEDIDIPVFFDVGTLGRDPLELGRLRASTGVGLRVKLPDSNQKAFVYFSQPVAADDTDDERKFHFGFRFDL